MIITVIKNYIQLSLSATNTHRKKTPQLPTTHKKTVYFFLIRQFFLCKQNSSLVTVNQEFSYYLLTNRPSFFMKLFLVGYTVDEVPDIY